MNFRQKVGVAILDVVVLIELTLSIYFANQNPQDFTVIFFRSSFPWLFRR